MFEFETLLYKEEDGVAWVTMNRPDALNAFNFQMQHEFKELWRGLRHRPSVRCVVLTGSGEKAFCVGIDRSELAWGNPDDEKGKLSAAGYPRPEGPWHFDDPGINIGPKTNDMWKPVIAAVNGMACGGAFYILGESDFIIAAEHATFFDPHTTFGMTAGFESIHMLQKMPLGEIMRVALLGAAERMSAARAHQIGLVTEVVPGEELADAAGWCATTIASNPPTAVQGTVRAIWMGRELSRLQALDQAKILIIPGSDPSDLSAGQEAFSTGQRKQQKPRIR